MTKVIAGITTSIDGYITGPDDGPGRGLGVGGEKLHYWVFGEPWTYDVEPTGEATGEDRAWLDDTMARIGAVVGGRWTYEAAEHWGDSNPWDLPFFIVTHRPEDQPDGDAFTLRQRRVRGHRAGEGRGGREGRTCHGRRRDHPAGSRR